jgi:hypothetical protein
MLEKWWKKIEPVPPEPDWNDLFDKFKTDAETCLLGLSIPGLTKVNEQEVDDFIHSFKVAVDGAHNVEQVEMVSDEMDRFQKKMAAVVKGGPLVKDIISRVERSQTPQP